jgi:hypothetical protein
MKNNNKVGLEELAVSLGPTSTSSPKTLCLSPGLSVSSQDMQVQEQQQQGIHGAT